MAKSLQQKRQKISKNKRGISVWPRQLFLSVLLVTDNSVSYITSLVEKIHEICQKEVAFFEILIVDNSSTDATVTAIARLQHKLPHVRLIVLSRKCDMEVQLFAGLENAIGDYVVVMDMTTYQPTLVSRLLAKAQEGFDVVIAERKASQQDETVMSRFLSAVYYKVAASLMQVDIASQSSYTRILSRRALNSIIKIRSKHRFLKYINHRIGFAHAKITYSQSRRIGMARPSLFARIQTGFDLIISNSVHPLRIVTAIGFTASLLNLLYLGYIFIVILVKRQIAEGWITTSVMSATMFFLLFSILTVISEYIARILEETKDQPLYFIAEETTSSVKRMKGQQKLNVR